MGKKVAASSSDSEEHAGRPAPSLQDIYERELVSKRHNCTDIICLILFFIFGLVQAVLSLLVFINGGDPRNFFLPHDSSGNLCQGSKPNLFYFDLVTCLSASALISGCATPSICVSTCPTSNLFYMIDSQRSTLYASYCTTDNSNAASTPSSSSYTTLVGNLSCPAYALSSQAYYYRCIPSVAFSYNGTLNQLYATEVSSNSTYALTGSSGSITDQVISQASQYITALMNILSISNSKDNIFSISFDFI